MQAQGAVEEVGAVSEQCSAEALTTGVPNAWLALRWLQSIQAPKPSVDADPSPGHAPFRLLPDILPQAYPCAPSPSSYSLTHACMHAQVRAGLLPLPPSRDRLWTARHPIRGVQGQVGADQRRRGVRRQRRRLRGKQRLGPQVSEMCDAVQVSEMCAVQGSEVTVLRRLYVQCPWGKGGARGVAPTWQRAVPPVAPSMLQSSSL